MKIDLTLPKFADANADWIKLANPAAAKRDQEASDKAAESLANQKEYDALSHFFALRLKHMAGMHNQKRHGWRYGGGEAGSREARLGAARTSMRRTPELGERSEYRRRAGLPTPVKRIPDLSSFTSPTPAPVVAPAPKPKRAPRPKVTRPKPPKPATYVELSPDDSYASHRDFHSDPAWKAWERNLTPKERTAIKDWVGSPGVHGTYTELNSALRRDTFDAASHPYSTITKTYHGMNSAIEKGRLHKDLVLWRSMDYAPMHSGAGTTFKKGDILPDKAFVATAPKKGTATSWFFMRGENTVLWKIKAPKGSKGAYLSWNELDNPYMHETEFVLPRNSRFQIDKVSWEYVSGKRIPVYEMTLLNEPGATKERHAPWSTTSTKHYAGQHNQKRHGWRYTGSGAARALRMDYEDPERAEYTHRLSARTTPPRPPVTYDPTEPTSSRPWGADIPLKYRPDKETEATILARHRRFLNEQGLGAISGGIDTTMKQLTNDLQTICDENPLCVRAPAAAVDRIIEDGRWKTQFESGTSYGAYYPEGRAIAERKGMGLPTSLPAQERPVYGFLRGAVDHDGSNGYGEVIFEMKPAVRDRTTVTVQDSLGNFNQGNVIGSPLKRVSLASAGANEYGSGSSIEPRRTTSGLKFNIRQDNEVGYFEAQIHGGLHLTDVAKATFGASCFEANGALKDPYRYEANALKELGIDVVLDPKIDSPADPLYVRYY